MFGKLLEVLEEGVKVKLHCGLGGTWLNIHCFRTKYCCCDINIS